jgi:hypothetical protein
VKPERELALSRRSFSRFGVDGIKSFILEEIRDRSITAHSRGINPPSIENQKLVEIGFPHVHEMCRLCHGAPGYPLAEFAQGLYPAPPNLELPATQQKWNNAQLISQLKAARFCKDLRKMAVPYL